MRYLHIALIHVLQITGHHIARLDPLGIGGADLDEAIPTELIHDKIGTFSVLSLYFSKVHLNTCTCTYECACVPYIV